MILILFILATMGMTLVLVNGSIFDDKHLGWRSWLKKKLGKWGDLVDCRVCTGWWAGFLCGIALLSWWNPLVFLASAFAGSALMSIYNMIELFVESRVEVVLGEDDEQSEQPEQETTT